MTLYPVVYQSNYKRKDHIICLCKTREEAEEMILAFTEDQPYEEYLNRLSLFPSIIDTYLYESFYNPLNSNNSNYFLGNPAEII